MARKRKRLTPPQRAQVKTFGEKAVSALTAFAAFVAAVAKIVEVFAKWFGHH